MKEGSYSKLRKVRKAFKIFASTLLVFLVFFVSAVLARFDYRLFICNLTIITVLLVEVLLLLHYYVKFCEYPKDDKYTEDGYLREWYNKTKKLMGGTKWITEIFDELMNKNLISISSKPLIFVSPSANKGVYEKALFDYLTDKKINSKFIVSDLEDIPEHERYYKNSYGEFIYYERRNAKSLTSWVKSVDVIWDFKGYLWYCLGMKQTEKNVKDAAKDVKNALILYNSILNKGGLIIIDDVYTNTFKRKASITWFHLTDHLVYFAEISTADKLHKLLLEEDRQVLQLRNYIDTNFEKKHISSKYKGISVKVLKKK